MTHAEIETVVASGSGAPPAPAAARLSPNQAIARIVAGGYERPLAEELVFTALGGGDLVVTGADGVARYEHSGRTVDEIEVIWKAT